MLYHTPESINSKFPSPPGASLPNLLKGKENTSPPESRNVVVLSISEQTKGTETSPGLCFQFFLALEGVWSFGEARLALPVGKVSTAFASPLQRASMKLWLCHCLSSSDPTQANFGGIWKAEKSRRGTRASHGHTEQCCFMLGSQAKGL